VSSSDFDRYGKTYHAVVTDAVRVAGVDIGRLAAHKAHLLADLMRRRLGSLARLRVLDVGCGVGLVERELTSRVGSVHGIDTSQVALGEAARAAPAGHFVRFDGKRFPYPDAAFDLTLAISVFHHVPRPDRVPLLREMARVTRAGGLVLVLEHNPFNPVTRYCVHRCVFDRDAALLRRGSAMRLLRAVGLESVSGRCIAFWPRPSAAVERIERRIGWLPVGAQYYACATKPNHAGTSTPDPR
jgi:SAM-dependent methyltransferase